jgi:POT family proton-dependent oligopeptide transporter
MATTVAPAHDTAFFGHPRGLSTLFFTEMWERFSYYGMRALLVLFMTTATTAANPGLGLGVGEASAIYGLYTALVYLVSLPGGWVADKLWGARRAVFVGGCIIAAGHFSMAIPSMVTFFLGLFLIVVGTGLLKPNISTMVGELYPDGGARRDAGFSVYYMGINIGAFFGPTLCGLVGEGYNFHWGFSLAGIGMVAGLIQYKVTGHYMGHIGHFHSDAPAAVIARRARQFLVAVAVALAAIGTLAFLMATGAVQLGMEQLAAWLGYGMFVMTGGFFLYILLAGGHTAVDKKRLVVILWLFLLSAVFWSGFEQAGSSMNIFARDLTDRTIAGWEMPASVLQNVNAFFIVALAPVFGMLWTALAARNIHPSIPLKFALGLFGLAAGFFVLAWGAVNATSTQRVSMSWLIVTYFLHTVGELCLSPVGLSSMTKLAPRGRTGQMMGVWFVGAALGNLFAGLFAGKLENLPPEELFWNVALLAAGSGAVALLLAPFFGKLTGGVK